VLLSGSKTFSADNPLDARFRTAELWVLDKNLTKPAVPLGEFCSEGPAVSRRNLKIAWTVNHANQPDTLPEDAYQFWMAEVDYSGGTPHLANKRLILDNRDLPFTSAIETQNFVPPEEKELTFSASNFQGSEVMGLDLATGKVTNYSLAPDEYDEPEGIFPDGRSTLVESDRHSRKGSNNIDLYRLPLDGSGRFERITFFNQGGKFKASNPVVSDDGRFIAFQVPRVEALAGAGLGIYVLDLEAAGLQ
jgi:Tol biopolymer transport system component